MVKKFLKIAGVKTEAEFYKKYPSEAAFFKAHPEAKELKQYKQGGQQKKLKQLTGYQGDIDNLIPMAQDGMTSRSLSDNSDIGYYTGGDVDDVRNIEDYRTYGGQLSQMINAEKAQKDAQLNQLQSTLQNIGKKAKKGKSVPKLQNAQYYPILGTNQTNYSIGANSPAGGTMTLAPQAAQANANTQNMLWGTGGGITQAPVVGGVTPSSIAGINMTMGGKGPGFDLMGALGGAQGIGNLAGGIIGGIKDIKNAKQETKDAEAMAKVSELSLRAAKSRPEETRRRYTRPEDVIIQPEQLFPSYGVGTNYLARNGSILRAQTGMQIGGNLTEIQNMYNPGDMYQDLGYEPLSESDDTIKQYQGGGMLGILGGGSASTPGIGGMTGADFGSLGTGIFNAAYGASPESQLGGKIGSVFGPVGTIAGTMVGKIAGSKREARMKNAQQATKYNTEQLMGQAFGQGIQGQFGSYMRNGGYLRVAQDGSLVMPNRKDYMDNEEAYQADMDIYMSRVGNAPTSTSYVAPPSRGEYMDNEEQYQADMDSYLSGEPVPRTSIDAPRPTTIPQVAAAAPSVTLNPYEGVSIVDFLKAQGKASDKASRAELARKLGISDYNFTGTQNTELMNLIRKNPNILSDMADAEMVKPSSGKKKTTASKSSTVAKAKAEAAQAQPKQDEGLFGDYYRNNPNAIRYTPSEQPQLRQSNTKLAPTGKVDPYERIIDKSVKNRAMTDYSTNQYFNERLQQTLGEVAATAGIQGAGILPRLGKIVEYTVPYVRQLPHVTATARRASRAIPYATRALGYENGGWVSNDWQPQVITKFGEYDVEDLLRKDPTMDTLRTGGNITQNNMYPQDQYALGGELKTTWGGYTESMSHNPYLPGTGETIMFRGKSHEESDGNGHTGIGVKYGDSHHDSYTDYAEYGTEQADADVEVERGEPAIEMMDESGDKNMVVFGNLVVPKQFLPKAGGKKFKNYVKELSEKEDKINRSLDKDVNALDNLKVYTPFDKLKMDALQANLIGKNMKLKNIADDKMEAASVQSGINDTAEEYGLDADALAKGKVKIDKKAQTEMARFGKNIFKAQGGTKLPALKQEDYEYLKGLYDEAKKHEGKGKHPSVLKFQQEYHRLAPDFAKQVIQSEPLTEYGKEKKLTTSDLSSNEDSLFGKRTVQYMARLDNAPRFKGKITPSTPVEDPAPGPYKEIVPDVEPLKRSGFMDIANQILPYLRPSDADYNVDLTPEMMALATNQVEPVPAQSYQPQLLTPYDVSYQDQLNEVTAQTRAAERLVGNNPAAVAAIAAEANRAKSGILGQQFRDNQAQRMGVYNQNIATLNDAKLKNLGIFDEQAKRQAMAKSNTKAQAMEAVKSMSDKIAKNKLENKTLQVYENLYNYRFDPSGRAINMNPLAQFDVTRGGSGTSGKGGLASGYEFTYDANGQIIGTRKSPKKDEDTGRNGRIVKAMKGL